MSEARLFSIHPLCGGAHSQAIRFGMGELKANCGTGLLCMHVSPTSSILSIKPNMDFLTLADKFGLDSVSPSIRFQLALEAKTLFNMAHPSTLRHEAPMAETFSVLPIGHVR